VPTDGARVTASPSDRTSPSANATTRAGAFVLKGLVPGAYTVRAMIGGTTPGDPDPPARDRELATVAVDVGAVDAVNVMLALAKAATIRGSVVFEGGPPPSAAASRMTVAVIPLHESGWPFWLPPPQAKVRDDLTFDLADVFRMPIAVAVQGLPQDLALKAIRYGGRDITYVPTDFTAGPPARLELVLTSEIAHLTIRVAHARGEETRTAIPIVLPADPSRWKLPYLTAPEEKTDGTLTFGALLPGDYLVAALSTDDYSMLFQDPSRFEAVARIATRVTLGKHDRQTLTIGVVPLPNK
jgi:hypothetical protein